MRIGAHVSTRGGMNRAIDRGVEIGAGVIQTHPSSARTWRPLQVDDAAAEAFRAKLARAGFPYFLHAVYLVNLAGDGEVLRHSVDSLVHTMALAGRLGAEGVVFHPGSHRGAGFAARLPQMVAAVREVLDRAAASPAMLVVENSAGAGGCVGCNLDEVGAIVHGAGSDRIGVCLDTCHAFASGYELRTDEGVQHLLDHLDGAVGFDRLRLVHANDSATELGSNRDRHVNVPEGCIGRDGFTRLLRDERLRAVPWVTETAGDGDGATRRHLDAIRELAGLPPIEPLQRSAAGAPAT